MSKGNKTYNESLLQWIWLNLEFKCSELKTTCGKRVEIISQGDLNRGAGPDFLNAKLRIGEMQWNGSIEIHNDAADWKAHGHDFDRAFNSVILHVVLDRPEFKVKTENGHIPYTLCLRPYLTKKLHNLLSVKEKRKLPCGGTVSYIHQRAFEKQVESAHREYFEFKVAEFIEAYNPHLVPSEAWKKCLISQVYYFLGMPSNRESMKELFLRLPKSRELTGKVESFVEFVSAFAFSPDTSKKLNWKESGMRPAANPKKRVKEAAALHYFINRSEINDYYQGGVQFWDSLTNKSPEKYKLGKTTSSILKNTVFLPALFSLGDIFHYSKIKEEAFNSWMHSSCRIPKQILNPFLKAGFSIDSEAKKLGLAHQYKRYCLEKQCHRCKVFKSAIRS
jgi:hypothetical protein